MNSKIALCAAKKVQIRGFLQLLKKQKKVLVEFDPLVWQAAVHYMVINEDCTVKFVFRDGMELPWMIDPGVKAYKKRKTVESCKRRRYAKGDTGSIPVRNIYGFDRDADGNIIVIEDEIKVVQRIFREFMGGSNCAIIADGLNADGIPTPFGGRKWLNRVVINILENEKYCGDCLFQKRFKVSPITKQQVNNKGELPKYLLEGEFPKAVDKRLWELVQLERKRRRENYVDMPSPNYPFRGKIFCATCGRPMVQQTIKTYGGKWVMYWRCAHFITRCRKGDDKPCTDARIPFDRPTQVFRQAWNLIVSKKTRYEATLKRTAEQNENPLVRYRAEDLIKLLDEVGRLDEFDYYTYIRTVDRMEVSTNGKLAVIFLAGVRITI